MKLLIGITVVVVVVMGTCSCENLNKNNKVSEPMVATTCPSSPPTTPPTTPPPPTSQDYLLQYQQDSTFLPTLTPGCITDKLEILKQCQKLYPTKDITNIVENSSKKITSICRKVGPKKKCGPPMDHVDTVVYRCLESPFQSDALLVPSPCIFDHIHNSTSCWDSTKWNSTAFSSCLHRSFKLKSFAVLLPCGVGLFTGVEFVCCPQEHVLEAKKLDKLDYEDYGEDDEGEEEEEEDEEDDYYFDEATTTTTTTTTAPSVDPYFTLNSETNEHLNFKQAEIRLENLHRMRMSKVMRDWEDLEKKYQLMKNTNSEEAEVFKKSVTLRFQKTIKNLEDEGNAEKRQLLAVHQQRVLSHLNERKKESMECFTTSLTSTEQNPNKVRKCLEKLMRILHKDRHHTLTHYKHLLKSNPKQAEIEKDYTLQRLTQISLTARQGLVMLERYPPLSTKLRPLIEDYVLSLQGRDDPVGESLLTATHETEKDLLDKLGQQHVTVSMTTVAPSSSSSPITMTTGGSSTVGSTTTMETMETDEKDFVRDQIISVRREVYSVHSNVPISTRPLYFTLTFAGITVLGAFLVGILILVKRRVIDHPRNHGFLEVNQQLSSHNNTLLKSPEEKHVANMQINGYENPTYKYFEQN